MFKNNLKIAWRNLLKDRQFTFLNLAGLATGLACTFLIYLWVHEERSVDKFNEKDNRLYAVMKTSPNSDGTIGMYGSTQGLLAKTMAAELPEVEYAVAVREASTGVVSTLDKHIKAKPEFVEKDFFKIFSYPTIEGDRNTAFSDINGVWISDKLALKLFGTTKKSMGQRIDYNGNSQFDGIYSVVGVFEAPPSNATDQFDFLFSNELFLTKEAKDVAFWGSNGMRTYVLLKKGTNATAFNKKIKDFTKEKIKALYKGDQGLLHWEGDLFIQRYSDRYLYNHFENGVQSGGRIEYVRLFSIIAIFLLVIACINFMNLSTAKASKRIKEVGIKKVVGAGRGSLILQYMGESMLMSFLALLIAVVIVALLLPAFREITGKEINLSMNTDILLSILSITVITGLVAGSYPALYLSHFKPALVLKGKLKTAAGESWLRKGLVVFQFAVSVSLIVSVIVVYKQMKLIQTTNLGFSKDNIIRFSNDGKLKENRASFLSEIKNINSVVNASGADGDFFGNAGHSGGGINWEGKDPAIGIEYYGVGVDYGFMEMMGLKMTEGRAFSKEFGPDDSTVIFNESAIAAMQLKNPVGKIVSLWGKRKKIIGIVKDFHFESLYKKVGPAFLTYSSKPSTILVKIKAGTEQNSLAQIAAVYKKFNDGLSLDYKFMDDDYQALYSSEQRVAVLSRYFAGIAIIISCLGLFGLAAFTAQKRQKEIGIRKVVGASVNSLAFLLSKDFLKLIIIALLIAFPLSWWAMNQWLQNFAYRTSIGAGVFVLAGSSMLIITLLTISFQAIKAAIANPVKSLRTE
jgi:ABC-type antimicrobial peptide transport system permease subunit